MQSFICKVLNKLLFLFRDYGWKDLSKHICQNFWNYFELKISHGNWPKLKDGACIKYLGWRTTIFESKLGRIFMVEKNSRISLPFGPGELSLFIENLTFLILLFEGMMVSMLLRLSFKIIGISFQLGHCLAMFWIGKVISKVINYMIINNFRINDNCTIVS